MQKAEPLAEIVSIGDEILLGQTVDTNAAFLAERLARLGLRVTKKHVVGDDVRDIAQTVREAAARSQVVILTGGLGPTRDDLTRQALADVAGSPLVERPELVRHVKEIFRRHGFQMPETNLAQARLPEGARVIDNERGTACGFALDIDGACVIALPGVPPEMRPMFDGPARELIRAVVGTDRTIATATVLTFGMSESALDEALDGMNTPAWMSVGTRAKGGVIGVRLTLASTDELCSREALDAVEAEVRRRLGDVVFGRDDDTLQSVVARMLIGRGLTIAVAESVTGGLIAHRLTQVPGVSASFLLAVVAYSNKAKTELLGVPAGVIKSDGAVSPAVAKAMAEGVRKRAGAALALASTGIAGPSGGSREKPVGLVYISLAAGDNVRVEERRFHGDRTTVKDRAAKYALNMLRLALARSRNGCNA